MLHEKTYFLQLICAFSKCSAQYWLIENMSSYQSLSTLHPILVKHRPSNILFYLLAQEQAEQTKSTNTCESQRTDKQSNPTDEESGGQVCVCAGCVCMCVMLEKLCKGIFSFSTHRDRKCHVCRKWTRVTLLNPITGSQCWRHVSILARCNSNLLRNQESRLILHYRIFNSEPLYVPINSITQFNH